jgi:hypothetical protein
VVDVICIDVELVITGFDVVDDVLGIAVDVEVAVPTTSWAAVWLQVWQYDKAIFVASDAPPGSFAHEADAHAVIAATA